MTLRLDGRLVNQWIGLLLLSCEEAFEKKSRLILDLGGLNFANHEGIQLLKQLQQRKVTLTNCSPFLREQLKESTKDLIASDTGE
jgi:hypothetical protein